MSTSSEIDAARQDVRRTRARLSQTITDLEDTVGGQVAAVKQRLDVVQLVKDNPVVAIAAAMGVGAFIAASGADGRVASAAVRTSRQATAAGMQAAREAPSRSGTALRAALDSLAVKLALSLIDALRQQPAHGAPPSTARRQAGSAATAISDRSDRSDSADEHA